VKLYNDFAQDIIDGGGAGTKEWGILLDTNRAKQLELESKPQNAETISEMENLITEKQELNLDLVDSIPEIVVMNILNKLSKVKYHHQSH
jgi:hypothetical protein